MNVKTTIDTSIEVKNKPQTFEVRNTKNQLVGVHSVSAGGIVWKPAGSSERKIAWTEFGALMEANVKEQKAKKKK